jgi:hypothetical protein
VGLVGLTSSRLDKETLQRQATMDLKIWLIMCNKFGNVVREKPLIPSVENYKKPVG